MQCAELKIYHYLSMFPPLNRVLEFVYVTTGNTAFRLALHLTGLHSRGELQHVRHVGEQKFICRPIRTREIVGIRL